MRLLCREMTSRDFQLLTDPVWLNDTIISAYFQLIAARSANDPDLPNVLHLEPVFVPRLYTEGYSEYLKRWLAKTNIFSFELIFMPFINNEHWMLICVDLKERKITFYDSLLSLKNYGIYLSLVHGVIKSEATRLKQKDVLEEINNWRLSREENWPRQENKYDCGIFVCLYGETLSRRAPPLFTYSNVHLRLHRTKIMIELLEKKVKYPDYDSAYFVNNARELMQKNAQTETKK